MLFCPGRLLYFLSARLFLLVLDLFCLLFCLSWFNFFLRCCGDVGILLGISISLLFYCYVRFVAIYFWAFCFSLGRVPTFFIAFCFRHVMIVERSVVSPPTCFAFVFSEMFPFRFYILCYFALDCILFGGSCLDLFLGIVVLFYLGAGVVCIFLVVLFLLV